MKDLPTKGTGAYEREGDAPGSLKRARRLRREAPTAERWLWRRLRSLHIGARRQHRIGSYIVDFAILSARLLVEIDGYHHTRPERQLRDATRTAWLTDKGFEVVRYPDGQVMQDPAKVAQEIADLVQSRRSKRSPPPSTGGGQGGG